MRSLLAVGLRRAFSTRTVLSQNVYDSFGAAVGNTALIKLQGPSKATGCNIYGKAEFQNPGGSIKDRAAAWILKEAEEQGILEPGKPGVIVEGTAGNTGIGLALAGNERGYKTIICIANTNSQEKKDMLRLAGAELLEVPGCPFRNPNNYVHIASRLAEQLRAEGYRVLYANQWDNLANRNAHIEGTGPEVWAQTEGKVDAFACAVGTGGTLSGMGMYLRSKNPKVKIALTDPCGGAIYRYYKEGELKAVGDSISEGIGQGRVTGQLADFRPDLFYEIPDTEAFPVLYDLLENEGLCLGSSSAINVAGAIRVAKDLGPGHTIVTVLADSGNRYASKIFNPTFLRSRGLQVPRWLDETAPRPAPLANLSARLPTLMVDPNKVKITVPGAKQ